MKSCSGSHSPVKAHSGTRGIHLEIESRRFDDFLLISTQAREAIGEGVGNSKIHTAISELPLMSPYDTLRADPNGAKLSRPSPKGAKHYSPGQRPGNQSVKPPSPEGATQPAPSQIAPILVPFSTDPFLMQPF